MSTELSIARSLRRANRKNKRSWRKISREDYEGKVKPGTLARIAKGNYFPHDAELRKLLGAPVRACPTCHRKQTVPRGPRPKPIRKFGWMWDLKPQSLLEMLNHREVMP